MLFSTDIGLIKNWLNPPNEISFVDLLAHIEYYLTIFQVL